MFSVVFEVKPRPEAFDIYLGIAKELRPILEDIDGFIDDERFESSSKPGWILSHSTWRDEKSVVRWRTTAKHHLAQERGRGEVFEDYSLRVGEIVSDTAPPAGLPIIEQRLDETETGRAKFVSLTEFEFARIHLANVLEAFKIEQPGLIERDLFKSLSNKRKYAHVMSWDSRIGAERYTPEIPAEATVRHRIVRIVREYGMLDRQESPRYYPDVPAPAKCQDNPFSAVPSSPSAQTLGTAHDPFSMATNSLTVWLRSRAPIAPKR